MWANYMVYVSHLKGAGRHTCTHARTQATRGTEGRGSLKVLTSLIPAPLLQKQKHCSGEATAFHSKCWESLELALPCAGISPENGFGETEISCFGTIELAVEEILCSRLRNRFQINNAEWVGLWWTPRQSSEVFCFGGIVFGFPTTKGYFSPIVRLTPRYRSGGEGLAGPGVHTPWPTVTPAPACFSKGIVLGSRLYLLLKVLPVAAFSYHSRDEELGDRDHGTQGPASQTVPYWPLTEKCAKPCSRPQEPTSLLPSPCPPRPSGPAGRRVSKGLAVADARGRP